MIEFNLRTVLLVIENILKFTVKVIGYKKFLIIVLNGNLSLLTRIYLIMFYFH